MKSATNLLMALAVVLLLVVSAWWFSRGHAEKAYLDPAKTVFFYGKSCSHCQATEKWFEEHQVTNKISFEQKEISTPAVQAELQQAVEYCQMDAKQGIGVPFLFAEGKCYMGSPAVEGYFQQKLNMGN